MRKAAIIFLLLFLFPLSCALTVTRVIDGDTVVLNNGRKVRLIGIDTPESFSNSKLEKDSQRTGQDMKTIQELGKRAAAFTRQFVERKEVSLKYGRQRKDRYGRTLGYLYLRDGTFVNLEIIRQGYANAYTQFPFEFMEEFRSAEKEAREDRRGLWAQ